MQARNHRKPVGKAALLLLLLLVFFYSWVCLQVYGYSVTCSDLSADAAIVLGAAVWDEGPSPVFEERIKHAIHLYEQGRVHALIFTGGVGRGDQVAESEIGKRYAVQLGVPAEQIYCETASRITYGNLQGAKEILDRQNLATALIVSDPLHMKRAMTIAQDLGIEAYPSPTPTSRYRTWRSKLGFLVRETRLYASYLIRRPFIWQ